MKGKTMGDRIGKIGKTLLASFVVLLASAFCVYQASGAVGVKADDWAKYTIDVTLDLPEGFPAGLYEQLEDMEWANVSVETVSGSTVTGKTVLHYENGTEDEEPFSGEVGTSAVMFIVEANLTEGDSVPVPFGPTEEMPINGTESRNYAGASREVNYVRISITEDNVTVDLDAYWDKLTGVLCEISMSYSGDYEGESLSISMDLKMTETNIWEAAPGFLGLDWWVWAVIIVVIVVVVGGGVVVMRRGKSSEE
jgi:hypothetical protein